MAIEFDGVGYVAIPQWIPTAVDDYTLRVWFLAPPGTDAKLMSNATSRSLRLGTNDTVWFTPYTTGPALTELDPGFALRDSSLHSVDIVVSPTGIELFVDESGTPADTAPLPADLSEYRVAAFGRHGTTPADAGLQLHRVELIDPVTPANTSVYLFDDGSGTTLTDSGARAADGTLTDFTDAEASWISEAQVVRKGATFDVEVSTSGTITGATLNGNTITIDNQTGTTVTLTDDASGITTSGEYDLVLDDGVTPETIPLQVNVVGLSGNTLNKDGSPIASLTDVDLEVFNNAGSLVKQLTSLATDPSGAMGVVDLSDLAEPVGETCKISLYSPSEAVGITFEQDLELI